MIVSGKPIEGLTMTKQRSGGDDHQWEGLKEIDRAISENRLMSYRWKKALADPWERRGLWLTLLIFFAFFAFVIGQDMLL
jgi:hypothetical protein